MLLGNVVFWFFQVIKQPGQMGGEFEARLIAPGRVLAERLLRDCIQRHGNIGALIGKRRRLFIQYLVDQGLEIIGRERRPAGQQFIQHHAQRIQIGLAGDLFFPELFGRHIARRTQHVARFRGILLGLDLGDAEIPDLDILIGRKQDV